MIIMELDPRKVINLEVPKDRKRAKSNTDRVPKSTVDLDDNAPVFMNNYDLPSYQPVNSDLIALKLPPKVPKLRKSSSKSKQESKKTQFPSVPIRLAITTQLGIINIPQLFKEVDLLNKNSEIAEEMNHLKHLLVQKENQLQSLKKELNSFLNYSRKDESTRSTEISSPIKHNRTLSNKIEDFDSLELSDLIKNRQLWLNSTDKDVHSISKNNKYSKHILFKEDIINQFMSMSPLSNKYKKIRSRKKNSPF